MNTALDILVILAPLAVIALFGWHLVKGLRTGIIYSAWEHIDREDSPARYWYTVVGYAVIILLCAFAASMPLIA